MKRIVVASLLILAMAMPAEAGRVRFKAASIGCPTAEGTIAAYKAAGQKPADFNTVQEVVSHFECKWLQKNIELTEVSRDPPFSVVVLPSFFSKTWLYVPSEALEPIP